MRLRAVAALLLVGFAPSLARATVLNGPVSGVLDPSGNPYIAASTIYVSAGDSLTVFPGVEIRIGPAYEFQVFGLLDVQGEEGAPVRMTCNGVPGQAWAGIRVAAYGVALLSHCEVSLYDGADVASGGFLMASGCLFERSTASGLSFRGGAMALVSECAFADNEEAGIHLFPGVGPEVRVEDSSFDRNRYPMAMEHDDFPSLRGLDVRINHTGYNGIAVLDQQWSRGGTWAAAGCPYVLVDGVTFPEGSKVTLEPGCVVKVWYSWLGFGDLDARGTGESPIVFTSIWDDSVGGDTGGDGPIPAYPGAWDWMLIQGDTTLEHCRIRFSSGIHAGGGSTFRASDCAVEWSGLDGMRLEYVAGGWIQRCTFIENEGDGISFEGDGTHTLALPVSDCTFKGNRAPISLGTDCFPPLSNLSVMEDHWYRNGIVARGHTLLGGRFTDPGCPYVVDGGFSCLGDASLTIEPGVVIKGELYYFGGGSTIACGTPDRPIVFTSLDDDSVGGDTGADGPSAGSPGSGLIAGFSGAFHLAHCVFRFHNSVDLATDSTVLIEDSLFERAPDAGLFATVSVKGLIRNCTFRDNRGPGISLEYVGAGLTISGCTFERNEVPVRLLDGAFPRLSDLRVSTDHAHHNGISLWGYSDLTGKWFNAGCPYVVEWDREFSSLTLDPGVIVKMGAGASLYLRRFLAMGTASDPVVFTSLNDDGAGGDTDGGGPSGGWPGYWGGVQTLYSGVPRELHHSVLRYAGTGLDVDWGAPLLDDVAAELCTTGLSFRSGASGTVRDCQISNNGTGVRVDATSRPVLGDLSDADPSNDGRNQFFCNGLHVQNLNPAALPAENCWWGEDPPDPSLFSGAVDYDPYLPAPGEDPIGDLTCARDGADILLLWGGGPYCGYRVLRSAVPDGGFAPISGRLTNGTFTDPGAGTGTTAYYYRVELD